MRAIFLLIPILLIAGCASAPSEPVPQITAAPSCSSAAQCDAMWAEAITQIQSLSGMRLQVVTDAFMQTYPIPRGRYDRLEGLARRMPHPDGSTTIEAEFSCRVCEPHIPAQALNLFFASVKGAGLGFNGDDRYGAAAAQNTASGPSRPKDKSQQTQQLMQQNLPYDEYMEKLRAIEAQPD